MINWQQHKKLIIAGLVILVLLVWYLYKTDGPVTPLMRVDDYGEGIGGSETMQGVTSKRSTLEIGQQEVGMPAAPMAFDAAGVPENVGGEALLTEARKVVRSGVLDLVVNKTEEAARRVQTIAQGVGGFVESLQVYEIGDGRKSGSVTIRVPAGKFTEVMESLKALAINTENEVVNTQDVTAQYVDMEARLKNMRAEEEQYLTIMERAVKIEDVLNVAQRLSDVRGRIEQLEAQLKLLKEEVEMSSIVVNLTAEGDIEVFGIHWRPLVVVRQAFRDMLESLTEYADQMIQFVFRLPVLLLWIVTWGVGLWVVWVVVSKIRKRWQDKNANGH